MPMTREQIRAEHAADLRRRAAREAAIPPHERWDYYGDTATATVQQRPPAQRPALVDPDPVATAIHEAGHVVAILALGHEVQSATIVPGGGAFGRVRPADSLDAFDRAAIDAAGYFAEDRYHPDLGHVPRLHGGDMRDASGLNLPRTLLALANEKSKSIIDANEAAVRAVANALLQHKTLSGEACAAIVQDAKM